MSESINHTGIVESISDDAVFVRITQQSACSGCHAQSMCTASEKKDKIIEIPDRSGNFSINESVMICGESSLGIQAVVFAFVIPLAIVVVAIIIGTSLVWEETTSGIVGLLLLMPYYGLLYLVRDRLKRHFVFTLKKLN